jgi:hypothetical protein
MRKCIHESVVNVITFSKVEPRAPWIRICVACRMKLRGNRRRAAEELIGGHKSTVRPQANRWSNAPHRRRFPDASRRCHQKRDSNSAYRNEWAREARLWYPYRHRRRVPVFENVRARRRGMNLGTYNDIIDVILVDLGGEVDADFDAVLCVLLLDGMQE